MAAPTKKTEPSGCWVFEGLRDRVLGAANGIFGDVAWAKDIDLRSRVATAADHFAQELEKLSARRSASTRTVRRQTFRLLGSFDARFCSLILAWPKGRPSISLDAAVQMAGKINLRQPSGEPVVSWLRAKPEGGFRRIWSFGPRTRAMQKLAVQILMALWGPAKFEFARRGRGRDAALAAVISNAEQKGGARWFLTADIKDCFGSFNRDALMKIIPFPKGVIENSLFVMKGMEIIHDDNDDLIHTSEIAVLLGLPQGSLASPYIVSKLIEPVLDQIPGNVVVSHSDDILVGSRTEKEAKSNMLLLGELMNAHPAGPLLMKSDVAPLGKPIDFLSYRVRRRWRSYGGGIRLTPSPKAFSRFEARAHKKLKDLKPSNRDLLAQDYLANWTASYRLWDLSQTGRDFLSHTMDLVISKITCENLKIKSLLHAP